MQTQESFEAVDRKELNSKRQEETLWEEKGKKWMHLQLFRGPPGVSRNCLKLEFHPDIQ